MILYQKAKNVNNFYETDHLRLLENLEIVDFIYSKVWKSKSNYMHTSNSIHFLQGYQNKPATGAFHLQFRILWQLLRMLVGQFKA